MVGSDGPFAVRFPIGSTLLFPAVTHATNWFVSESPRWLLRKGQIAKAENALRTLHREDKTYDTAADMRGMQADVDQEMELQAVGGWMQLLTDPIERRKVLFSAGALVAQQTNGIQWFYSFRTVF